MAQLIDVTDETFDAEIKQADTLVVAEFYTRTCPVCKKLMPVLEQLADDYGGKVRFVKLDVANAAEQAQSFAIFSAPTILFLKSGKEVARSAGYADNKKLAGMIDAQL